MFGIVVIDGAPGCVSLRIELQERQFTRQDSLA
jgi:hypothetical protein